jgi:Chaperone of endosialidase/Secretion system C-terminal sorting domain
MKTNLLFILLFLTLCCSAQVNRSAGNVTGNFTGAIPAQQLSGNEIFRFQPGYISLLDNGNNFDLTTTSPLNSRWFSMGGVPTGPSRRAFGLRFQDNNKALTFGYQNVNDVLNINPRIERIGNGAALGNLEFRVANSFTSTVSTLVATMKKNGNTVFGIPALNSNNAKVEINNNGPIALEVNSTATAGQAISNAMSLNAFGGTTASIGMSINTDSPATNIGIEINSASNLGQSIAISAFSSSSGQQSVGFEATTFDTANFEAAIKGNTGSAANRFAGFFNGKVFATGLISSSDAKLKENVKPETSALEKISKLKPVTYDYKTLNELNLPKGNQHGFIAQELAVIFPELTENINLPKTDRKGNIISTFDFKSVNYNGLISILTAGIKELNNELKSVKEELVTLKNTKNSTSNLLENNNKAFMEQNIPNPFTDQTTIRYQLPVGSSNANIMVMDLNGKLIKNYDVNNNQSEITIKASEIGKGFFIYSLVQNGQELVTKKMIIN